MNNVNAESWQSMKTELKEIALRMARERGLITSEQDLVLIVRSVIIPAQSDDPWTMIFSLSWSPKRRMVLERLQKENLTGKEFAQILGHEYFYKGLVQTFNSRLRDAGLKHCIKKERKDWHRPAEDVRIWMHLDTPTGKDGP